MLIFKISLIAFTFLGFLLKVAKDMYGNLAVNFIVYTAFTVYLLYIHEYLFSINFLIIAIYNVVKGVKKRNKLIKKQKRCKHLS